MVVETALYERLGVTHDASTDQIRRSYRQAALLWHPDRNRDDPAAAEKFKACLEAYEILSNPNQRTLYDAYGLSGVLRTGGDPEMSPEAQPQRTTSSTSSSSRRQRSYRQRPQPPPFDDSFFNDDDFLFPEQSAHFDFPRPARPMHSQTQTQSQSQSQSQSQQAPRGFSFSSSFTFSTSSSTGGDPGGSYTTHTHSWNSRDGHQSHRSSGTFGPEGPRVSSSNRDGGDDGSRRVDGSSSSRRNSQRTRNYTDENAVPQRSQSMQSQQQSSSQPAQGMQHPFNNMGGSGGGMFDMGSNFNNLFAGMSNNFASFFGNNFFGEPESNTRPQQSRQRRQ